MLRKLSKHNAFDLKRKLLPRKRKQIDLLLHKKRQRQKALLKKRRRKHLRSKRKRRQMKRTVPSARISLQVGKRFEPLPLLWKKLEYRMMAFRIYVHKHLLKMQILKN